MLALVTHEVTVLSGEKVIERERSRDDDQANQGGELFRHFELVRMNRR